MNKDLYAGEIRFQPFLPIMPEGFMTITKPQPYPIMPEGYYSITKPQPYSIMPEGFITETMIKVHTEYLINVNI